MSVRVGLAAFGELKPLTGVHEYVNPLAGDEPICKLLPEHVCWLLPALATGIVSITILVFVFAEPHSLVAVSDMEYCPCVA